MLRLRFLSILTVLSLTVTTRLKAGKNDDPYPQGYFIMPISPGEITSLSGCFGDIRINHFHAGLDIRTGGVEGKNVYAAAEGYVSRIKIMKGGYGNALYITHPNGLTTVYAHLKEYLDSIDVFIRSKQYERQSWEIDVELKPHEIPVRKGQIVALSGNTGGSAGPHLHFEIRDKEEHVLDPAMFGFRELKDVLSPTIEYVSLKCMSKDARINGKFGIFTFTPVKTKTGNYTLPAGIEASGDIAIEVLTFDKAQNSPFRLGVKQIELQVNREPVYLFRLDRMSFDNKLDMNVHVNYEKLVTKSYKIHKCYVEAGNSFNFYKTNSRLGIFSIEGGKQHPVSLVVTDAFGNASSLDFTIRGKENPETDGGGIIIGAAKPLKIVPELYDHFLVIKTQGTARETQSAIVSSNGRISELPMAYGNGGEKVFIHDLNDGLVDFIQIENLSVPSPVNYRIDAVKPVVTESHFSANFREALYGPLFLNLSSRGNELNLDKDIIPLKKPATVKWKTDMPLNFPEKQKVYIKAARPKFVGGTWAGNEITFDAKELGTYQILSDFDPPRIAQKTVNAEKLVFVIADALSGIRDFRCTIDGEWILMDYEYKNGQIWSRKADKSKPFKGKVELTVTDNCNNTQVFETYLD